jgi:hypothetical protein
MIELAAIDENKIADAEKKLLPVVGDICEYEWLTNGVQRGFYKAVEVRKNGVAQYRYFYHLNDQNFVNVNASIFVGNGASDKWLWGLGADMIARLENARGIICCTNRLGHIEQARRAGYKILGVLMCKEINL